MAEKTSSSKASSSGSGIINQLDEATINLIAAGEILQRPLNAVKELVENSLDSRANRIDVSLRRSGLKTLQVADNGCGIVKQDLALLCRRFCTSKLSASAVASASEQHQSLLSNLQSFGFRGEALASLSHSSRVEVRSKSLGGAAADEPSSQSSQACAFEAHYSDGRLIGEVKACAGNNGTIITAYDLFFNNKCRLAAFRERDEMTLCIDYLMKIALHYPSIAFSLKDLDRDTIVFKTSGESDPRAIISNLFNSNLRDELVSVMFDSDDPEFTCQGFVTHANFSIPKYYFILFINDRLVTNDYLRRNILAVYSSYLPKTRKPFVYLSLKLPQKFLDVNIHPTKEKVSMINESIICDKVCGYISSLILSHSRSRTFNASSRPKTLQFQPLVENYSKSLNSIDDNHIEVRNSLLSVDSVEKSHSFSALNDEQSHSTLPSNASYYQSDRFISRNSPKAIKIENFAKKSSSCVQDGPSNNNDLSQIATVTKNYEACDKNEPINSSNSGLKIETINLPQKVDDSELTSIKELKASWKIDICDKIINTLIDSTFVGTVSESQILIQHQTTLLLMDFQSCFQEFIYQNIIMTFSKLPKIQIENPLDLDALILLGLELPENGYSEDSRDLDKNITSFAKKTLISNKDMLSDFFSIDIDAEKECLTSFPQVHPRIHPPFAFLPSFLLKIVAEIDWCDEKECIKGLALSLSEFFSLPDPQVSEDEKYNRIGYYFQHLILNTVKDQSYRSRFMPSMALRNIFKPIVNLQDMYKIFERC